MIWSKALNRVSSLVVLDLKTVKMLILFLILNSDQFWNRKPPLRTSKPAPGSGPRTREDLRRLSGSAGGTPPWNYYKIIQFSFYVFLWRTEEDLREFIRGNAKNSVERISSRRRCRERCENLPFSEEVPDGCFVESILFIQKLSHCFWSFIQQFII